jgi:hypothetical protein
MMERIPTTSSGSTLLRAWGLVALAGIILVAVSIWYGPSNIARSQLRAEALVECYQQALGLEEWDIVVWMDSLPRNDGETVIDDVQLTADIYLDTPFWEVADNWHRRELVIHEIAHVRFVEIFDPLWEIDSLKAEELEERFISDWSRTPILMRWRCGK